MIEDLYLRQPTPEYRQAFDLAVSQLNRADGPVLAVLSSAAHAVDLLKRCPRPLDLAGTGTFAAADFVSSANGWVWGAVRAVTLAEGAPGYAAILWAEPEDPQARSIATLMRRLVAGGAVLVVITSGPLRGHLPAWQFRPFPVEKPLSPGRVTLMLRAAGWQVEHHIIFHGPRAIVWSYLARAAHNLNRPDWADRCTFAAREYYREAGWTWPLAPLALIRARAM